MGERSTISDRIAQAILDASIGVLERRAAALRGQGEDAGDQSRAVVLFGTARLFEASAADIAALDPKAIVAEADAAIAAAALSADAAPIVFPAPTVAEA